PRDHRAQPPRAPRHPGHRGRGGARPAIAVPLTRAPSNAILSGPPSGRGTMRSRNCLWLTLAMIVGVIGLRPRAPVAQPPTKLTSVGIIFATSASDPLQPIRKQALRDTGYVEGQTIEVHWRFAEGHNERLPALARELVARDVLAIVTFGGA